MELITGFVFLFLFLKFENIFFVDLSVFGITYLYYATIFSILMVIAVYDLKHKIIPDILSFLFGLLAFLGLFFFQSNNFFPHFPTYLEFLSGIFISSPFALFWLVSRGRWMGFGDAKLAIGIGWLLGFSVALSSLALAFWSGSIIGVVSVFFKKYGMKSEVPFAPYLVLGTFLAFIFQFNFFGI